MISTRPAALKRPGDFAAWLGGEIRDFSEDVSAAEARNQIRLGNAPTALALDNKRPMKLTRGQVERLRSANSAVEWPRYSQTWLMQDVGLLEEVLRFAWERLAELTRVKSGRALRSYYFVLKNPVLGRTPRRVRSVDHAVRVIREWASPDTGVGIYGPTVIYRRKVLYNPRRVEYEHVPPARAESRLRLYERERTTVTEYARRRGKRYRVKVRRALHKTVARNIRTRFGRNAVWAGYGFVRSRYRLNTQGWHPRAGWSGENRNIPALFFNLQTGTLRARRGQRVTG